MALRDVSLLTTLHDALGWSIEPLHETSKTLNNCYSRRFVVVTEGTSRTVIETLKELGWELCRIKAKVGVDHISDSRRSVLAASMEAGSDWMHIVDMDRMLHWARTYPEEQKSIVDSLPQNEFTIYGRSPRALATHPQNQVETEQIPNKVFSLIYGRNVDITAASRGISKAAAEKILTYSRGRFFDTDSEWPIILKCKSQLGIAYREVEGLEWETRLKRSEWIHPDGRRTDLKEFYENNPESWVYRTMLAYRISECALKTYRLFKI